MDIAQTEAPPEGKEGQAPKTDGAKTRFDLVPPKPLRLVADTYELGACKYDEESWRSGFETKRLIGAAERHISYLKEGFDVDYDSGCFHAAQVIWNMIKILQQTLDLRSDLDNRVMSKEIYESDFHIKDHAGLKWQRLYFKDRCDLYLMKKTKGA